MCILMYFKIQSEQPRITRNALKSQIFDLFTKSSSGYKYFIYIKMHIPGLVFALCFLKLSAGKRFCSEMFCIKITWSEKPLKILESNICVGFSFFGSLQSATLLKREHLRVTASQYSSPSLRGKFPYSEFFWSVFSRIQIEYGDLLRIFSYSVRMRENTDQKNSEYGHFWRSAN